VRHQNFALDVYRSRHSGLVTSVCVSAACLSVCLPSLDQLSLLSRTAGLFTLFLRGIGLSAY